jgi:hypothetical protein
LVLGSQINAEKKGNTAEKGRQWTVDQMKAAVDNLIIKDMSGREETEDFQFVKLCCITQ